VQAAFIDPGQYHTDHCTSIDTRRDLKLGLPSTLYDSFANLGSAGHFDGVCARANFEMGISSWQRGFGNILADGLAGTRMTGRTTVSVPSQPQAYLGQDCERDSVGTFVTNPVAGSQSSLLMMLGPPDIDVDGQVVTAAFGGKDDKGLSTFTGRDSDWPEWAFEARAEFVCRGLLTDEELDIIEHSGMAFPVPTDAAAKEKASRVYHLLAKACKGASNLILRKVARGNGCEAWRLLHLRYDHQDGDSSLDVLGCILDFDFGDGRDLEDRYNRFEILVQTFNLANIDELSEDVLKSVCLRRLPQPLRGQLELQVDSSTSWQAVKQKIQEYLRHHREFKPNYVVPDAAGLKLAPDAMGLKPMDLSQVVPHSTAMQHSFTAKKGKGKGKGKNKKGKQMWSRDLWPQQCQQQQYAGGGDESGDEEDEEDWNDRCWVCSGWGHRAKECPSRRRRVGSERTLMPLALGVAEAPQQSRTPAANLRQMPSNGPLPVIDRHPQQPMHSAGIAGGQALQLAVMPETFSSSSPLALQKQQVLRGATQDACKPLTTGGSEVQRGPQLW